MFCLSQTIIGPRYSGGGGVSQLLLSHRILFFGPSGPDSKFQNPRTTPLGERTEIENNASILVCDHKITTDIILLELGISNSMHLHL